MKLNRAVALSILAGVSLIIGCGPKGSPESTVAVVKDAMDESATSISDEPMPDLCGFDRTAEFQNIAITPGNAYYTSRSNTLFHINFDEYQVEGESYTPNTIAFDEKYILFDIATGAGEDVPIVVSDLEGDILTVEPDNRAIKLVAEAALEYGFRLTVSDDGQWIGYSFQKDDPSGADSEMAIINSVTGERINFTDDQRNYSAPIFSPADSLAAYAIYDGESSRIHILNLENLESVPLTPQGSCYTNIVWSPDGRYLAAVTSLSTEVSDTLSVIHVESGIETELFKIDPALSFIHDISGWSPSGEYIMYISKERNQEETNICISSAVTGESNCPHLTVDKLTVPFWLSDSANIGLLHFNSDGSEQFKNSDRLDVGNIDFSHIEIVELLGSDEP